MSFSGNERRAMNRDRVSPKSCGFIKSVYQYFVKERDNSGFLQDPYKVYLRTAEATRIHQASVAKIIRERESESSDGKYIFKTPGKKKSGRSGKGDISCFVIEALRQKVYEYYFDSRPPRIVVLADDIRKSGILPNYRRTSTIGEILRLNGFKFKRYSGRVVMLERNDVIIKRCRFLKKIKEVDMNTVLWVGETCFNIPVRNRGSDKTFKAIVFHAGTRDGFLEKALLLRPSKLKSSYLNEISCSYFQKWFFKILKSVPMGTSIIIEDVRFHNAEIDKPPNSFSDKETIIDWLNRKDIPYEEGLLKAELLDLVRMAKPILPSYSLEILGAEKGFKVIRLPPFHNHFNAIETIWEQVKKKVDDKFNSSSDRLGYENIIRSSINEVMREDWEKAVDVAVNYIRKSESLEPDLESAVESVFKQIDITKKSGREDLESVSFCDAGSESSDHFSEASEGSGMDINESLQGVEETSQTERPAILLFEIASEVTVTTTESDQIILNAENVELNDAQFSCHQNLSSLTSKREKRVTKTPKKFDDSILL